MNWILHMDDWRAGEHKSSLCLEGSRSVVINFRRLFLLVCKHKRSHLDSASEKRADSLVSEVVVLSPKPVKTNTVSDKVKVHR